MHRRAGRPAVRPAQKQQAQLQTEQLLKHQPAAGGGRLLGAARAVDGPHRLHPARQPVAGQQGFGQGLGQGLVQPLERRGHRPGDLPAAEPLGLRVNGDERLGLDLLGGALQRVYHLAPGEAAAHPALKEVPLANRELGGGVGVVEPGDGQRRGAVPRQHPVHGAPPGQPGGAGFGKDLSLDHAVEVKGGLGHRVGVGIVEIAAGVVGQQLAHRADAQPREPPGQLGPHPPQILHRCVRLHGGRLLSGFSPFLRAGALAQSPLCQNQRAGAGR